MLHNKFTFFSFSGYTKGLFSVTNIEKLPSQYRLEVKTTTLFYDKLNKKQKSLASKHQFQSPYCIEIDGVPGMLEANFALGNNNCLLRVAIPAGLYEKTTLKEITIGSHVSLGLQSFNAKKYLVGQYTLALEEIAPVRIATILSCETAPGHTHTQKLAIKIPEDFANLLKDKKCISLNGGAFYIQSLQKTQNDYIVEVEIGQSTREKTIFGTSNMKIGQKINVGLAFTEEEAIHNFKCAQLNS